MTVPIITSASRAPAVLYPSAPGGHADPCWACFQPGRPGMAATTDPRVGGGDLVRVCGACHRALVSGLSAPRPLGVDLPGLLTQWARWDANGEVDDEFVGRMLAALVPGLPTKERAVWWECLKGALLEVQEHDEFGFELLSVEPEARDAEALAADAAQKVTEILTALIGDAR